MTLSKQGNFTFNHVDQQDDLYKVQSALEIKTDFDSRANELKATLNTLIDDLNATTTGNSGAKNIGSEPIAGLAGSDVYSLMVALKNQMDSTVLGQIPDGAVTEAKLSSDVKAGLIDYAATTGTANAYVVTLNPAPTAYTDGMAISVKINADATAASTLNANSLGAKSLKKSNGTDVTNLKTNGVYTFRYNSTTGNFILQGEGGSGTATAPDVLAGKTASTDTGDITGTMIDRGAMTITPGTTDQIIPTGFHNGSGKVVGDADLISANILSGKNISGVDGSLVPGKKWASSTFTWNNSYISVSTLSFRPKRIVFEANFTASGTKKCFRRTMLDSADTYELQQNKLSSWYVNSVFSYQTDLAGAITDNGFNNLAMPADTLGYTWTWTAYEG
jgi:hypothetical protein